MDDIVQRIKDLQESYDKHYKLEEQYRKLFELAGYDLYDTDDEGRGRPKDVKELIAEALGNPPTDNPGKWIRIADIPNYIQQYLIVPAREDLDYFNDASSLGSKTPMVVRANGEIKNTPEEEPEPVFVNETGEQESYEFTGKEWQKASLVPDNTTFVDDMGVVWYKAGSNRIADVANFDQTKPDYYLNADVSSFPPLREIKYD